MCGICGFYTKTKYDMDILKKMNDSLTHRGPDDHGEEIYASSSGRCVGLGQRRLSIMDLTSAGHQPMHSDDDDVIVTFNGEIYNFMEIRSELEREGISFSTRCDTEVVLKAYIRYGTECFERFNGMFAIVIYDRTRDCIILARDRMGVKPLYYYFDANSLIWGSELKPIMLCPAFVKELRTDVLSRFFCNDYIASPDTIFEHTYKVEPGQFIICKAGTEPEKKTFWSLTDRYHELSAGLYTDYTQARTNLQTLLEDSVRRRMVADVPVGIFLSGGIDSTLVAALAQKVSSAPVRTYTIGFDTKEENEAIYAGEVAKALGTDHTELYIGEKELFDLLEAVPDYYDEPFADPSLLPTMLVSKLARQDVTVVLSGDGGDELFCGYEMYDWLYKGQRLDAGAGLAYALGGRYWGKKMPNIVYSYIMNRDPGYKVQFVESAKERILGSMLVDPYMSPKYDIEAGLGVSDWQIRRMLLDMKTYLPDDILCKVDRASMRYSLETRNPLIDYRVVEESFKMPHSFKYKDGDKKHILKDITYSLVDRSLLDRPKQGFGVPLRAWLMTYLNNDLKSYADPDKLRKQGLFKPEFITGLISDMERSDKTIYSTLAWCFYVFQRWYARYMEDLWA